MTDFILAMEARVKADQAKAALAGVKTDITAVGTAAKEASVDSAKIGPALENGARGASPAVQALQKELLSLADAVRATAADSAAIDAKLTPAAISAKRAFEGLNASIDPLYASSMRYNQALSVIDAALRENVISEKQAERAAAAVAAQFLGVEAAAKGASPHVATLGREMAGVGTGSALGGNGARMMAMQLSQVGQQTMATGNFVQALAIQLPDIGLAFGAVGTAVGLLAGVALPVLMSAFGGTSGTAATLDEGLSELLTSISDYERFSKQAAESTVELGLKFGDFAGQVRGFSEYMRGVSLGKSLDDMKTTIEPLKGGLADIVKQFRDLEQAQKVLTQAYAGGDPEKIASAKEIFEILHGGMMQSAADLGLTVDQALRLATAIDQMGSAKSLSDMRDKAAEALSVLQQMVPVGLELPAPLRETAAALQQIVEQTAAATSEQDNLIQNAMAAGTAIWESVSAVEALVSAAPGEGWLSGAISDAARLAGKLWDAVDAAAAARAEKANAWLESNQSGGASYMASQYSQYGAGHRAMDTAVAASSDLYWQPSLRTSSGRGGKGGSGGGGGAADPDSFKALTDAAEKAMATLEAAVASIHEKVALGLMTTAEGTKAIASAKEQAATSIAELIPKLEKANDVAGPKAAAAVGKWRAEVKALIGDLGLAGAELSEKLSSNFEKAFAAFLSGAKGGKAAMADFKNFILQQLAEIAAQKFTSNIISPLLDSLVGGIFGVGAGGGGGTGSMGLPMPFAKGGAPDAPLSAYANSVVDKPTLFPMANGGVGEMGEAGREAILPIGDGGVLAKAGSKETRLPLERGGDGRLGVRLPDGLAKAFSQAPDEAFARGGVPGKAKLPESIASLFSTAEEQPASPRAEAPRKTANLSVIFGLDGGGGQSPLGKAMASEFSKVLASQGVAAPTTPPRHPVNLAQMFGMDAAGSGAKDMPVASYGGSIIDRPGFFPLAKATSDLRPEAQSDPAAQRSDNADARRTVGKGGAGSPVTVNVINNAQGTKTTQRERTEGGMSIIDVVIEQVEASIAGNIAQGRGPMPDALSGTYGLSRIGS